MGRRSLLLAATSGGVGLATGCGHSASGGGPVTGGSPAVEPRAGTATHQPGIVSPPLAYTLLTAYDVTVTGRDGLTAVLRAVTAPQRGHTVTVSWGLSLFGTRFGLPHPPLLTSMPAFTADVLDQAWSHGDLLVQIQSENPITTPAGVAGLTVRWRIAGRHAATARNHFGFREGAGNPDPADRELMDDLIWEPGGGTYQVVRLIGMAMPSWESEPVAAQERIIGRHRDNGAPLGGEREQDTPDYTADPDGVTIALDAHIRRANPRTADSQANRILRRGWSYTGGGPPGTGDAGQIFVCYQRDPEKGFAATQHRLAGEAMEKYLLPFGGGYFFTPPAGDPFPPVT
ncbi:iron uptake transporter deferrochelatase/peroxidase subunit [Winogradskya consettensis]|uniref:Dyp-type peroxidase n=1 Tax=Winogradskya consettensis TaxID=113560 RepID=A0A919SDM7_9ACTN|nr:hypothetical protein Aco04nite_16840 [Actinoplanes consettensis]